MRFLNGLIGLLLVGATACTGFAQNYGHNAYLLSVADGKQTARVSQEEDTNGGFAYASTVRLDCNSLNSEIMTALASPKFDPSYNGDPSMPDAKKAFQDARVELAVSLGSEADTYFSALGNFNTWVNNHQASVTQATLYYWAGQNTPYKTYSEYAVIETNFNNLITLLDSYISALEDFETSATNVACTLESLKFNMQTLLDSINAY